MDLSLDLRAAMITKDAEDGWAEFEGVASSPAEDLTGDILESGCFDPVDTKHVAMLWAHNGAEPVGKWSSIGTVAGRLVAKGRLRLTLGKGREAYDAIKHKIATGLSVGFRTMPNGMTFDDKGRRRVTKARLMEISIVSVPANGDARITDVRSFDPTPLAARIDRFAAASVAESAGFRLRLDAITEKLIDAVGNAARSGEIEQARAVELLQEFRNR